MEEQFTRSERQLLALIKVLRKTGILSKNEMQDIAMEYAMLTINMNIGPEGDPFQRVLNATGEEEMSKLMPEEDRKWFMGLSAMADPEETLHKMGYKSIEELRASMKSKRR